MRRRQSLQEIARGRKGWAGMAKCKDCGLDHRRLGVEIKRHTLRRKAHGLRHLLKLAGGAWAFRSELLDKHPEVQAVEVSDLDFATVYLADRATLDRHSFRRDLGQGEQVILPLDCWTVLPLEGRELQTLERQVEQLQLFDLHRRAA